MLTMKMGEVLQWLQANLYTSKQALVWVELAPEGGDGWAVPTDKIGLYREMQVAYAARGNIEIRATVRLGGDLVVG